MAEKTYRLTITYDENTDEIIEFKEYLDIDKRWFSVGDVDLTDYWDEESISWVGNMHDLGES